MSKQKITSDLLLLLRVGDIIFRFPCDGEPENEFDEDSVGRIHSFQIRSINTKNDMVELVIDHPFFMFPSPGDINRLFIKSYELVTQKIWWIEAEYSPLYLPI